MTPTEPEVYYDIRVKEESRLMRAIAWLLAWTTPGFLTDFATTLGHTIYLPTRYRHDEDILDHEIMHVVQWERWGGVLFVIRYVLPWSRALIELEAYGTQFDKWARLRWKENGRRGQDVSWVTDALTDSTYLWAWPFMRDALYEKVWDRASSADVKARLGGYR